MGLCTQTFTFMSGGGGGGVGSGGGGDTRLRRERWTGILMMRVQLPMPPVNLIELVTLI